MDNELVDIKTKQAVQLQILKTITARMDKHEEQEDTKAKERAEDRRATKNFTLTIIGVFLTTFVSFMVWLNDFTDNSNLRFQKIETIVLKDK